MTSEEVTCDCRRKFCVGFPGVSVPLKSTTYWTMNKFRKTGSL